MKRRTFAVLLMASLLLAASFISVVSFAGGEGNDGYGERDGVLGDKDWTGYIEITDAGDLMKIGNVVGSPLNGKYYLSDDIDITSEDFAPIGSISDPFTGIFDGDGHTIFIDIRIEGGTGDVYAGLFACIGGATIRDLNVTGDVYADSDGSLVCAGGIAGYAEAVGGTVTIDGCFYNGSISANSFTEYACAGGIAGRISAAGGTVTIDGCYNKGGISASSPIEGYAYAGSIAGMITADDGIVTIDGCYNTGGVCAESLSDTLNAASGGIAGYIGSADGGSVTITNCYNEGGIQADGIYLYTSAGGIAGWISADDGIVTIEECYNTGEINACSISASAGGIAGAVSAVSGTVSIENCYNAGKIHIEGDQQTSAGGITGYVKADDGTVTIKSCYNTDANDDSCTLSVGGISGSISAVNGSAVTIEMCYNMGYLRTDVPGYAYVGGILGYAYAGDSSALMIKNCYNAGDMWACLSYGNYGGILGYAAADAAVITIENCYNVGVLEDPHGASGSILGTIELGTVKIINCYFLEDTDANMVDEGSSAQITGNNAASTESEMEDESTYFDWDFDNVWAITDGEYPTLRSLVKPIKYDISEDSDSEWTGEGSLVITVIGKFEEEDLEGMDVYIDGLWVDPDNYEAKLGSIDITLKELFLKSLSNGVHQIEIFVKGGVASTTLTISATEEDALDGTLAIILNTVDGTLTADVSEVTGGSGAFTYEWSGTGVTDSGTDTLTISEYALGDEVTLTVTRADATGSRTATITVFKVTVTASGDTDTDEALILEQYGEEGYAISIGYILSNFGSLSNTLTYSGVASEPTQVTAPGSATSEYIIDTADAADGVIEITATFAHADLPVLGGTLVISLNTANGALTADTSEVTGGSGAFANEWSGTTETTHVLALADYVLGSEVTLTVTRADASGSLTATITVFEITLTAIGRDGTENVSADVQYGVAGSTVVISYTLDANGSLSETLTYSGVASAPAQVNTAGTGTSNYTVSAADAVSGVIAITATFAHLDVAIYEIILNDGGTGAAGAGFYPEDHVVEIYAGDAPAGMRFAGWTSDVGVTFADEDSVSTTFIMPAEAVEITAVWEDIPPTVVSVTPSGTGAAVNGDIVITFSEAMNEAVEGTVEINGVVLTGGSWISSTVFTIPYNGLANSTLFSVSISGFEDVAGTEMDADSSNSFTTVAATLVFTGPFSIPASTVGTAIDPVEVLGGVSGGTTPYVFSASGLPTGLSIHPDTGVISGTPSAATAAGSAMITVTDNDGFEESILVSFGAVSAIPVTFTASQTGGTSGTDDSTGIVITFSAAVTGLDAGDITVTNGTGSVTVGTLSGSGTTWTLILTAVAAEGDVTVSIGDFGDFEVTTVSQEVAVYKDTYVPPTTYAVSVANGTGSASHEAGQTVTITADAAPEGKVFDKWTTTTAGVTFADANSATTTFVMPAGAVSVTATYKDAPVDDVTDVDDTAHTILLISIVLLAIIAVGFLLMKKP